MEEDPPQIDHVNGVKEEENQEIPLQEDPSDNLEEKKE